MRKRHWLAGVLGMVVASIGCDAASSNTLIGSWTRIGSDEGCARGMKFTADRQTISLKDGDVSNHVTYNTVDPKMVTVIAGGYSEYNIIDKDHITLKTPFGDCNFKRA